jgi:hypothetical protein
MGTEQSLQLTEQSPFQWFMGTVPRTDAVFERFVKVTADTFNIVTKDG